MGGLDKDGDGEINYTELRRFLDQTKSGEETAALSIQARWRARRVQTKTLAEKKREFQQKKLKAHDEELKKASSEWETRREELEGSMTQHKPRRKKKKRQKKRSPSQSSREDDSPLNSSTSDLEQSTTEEAAGADDTDVAAANEGAADGTDEGADEEPPAEEDVEQPVQSELMLSTDSALDDMEEGATMREKKGESEASGDAPASPLAASSSQITNWEV